MSDSRTMAACTRAYSKAKRRRKKTLLAVGLSVLTKREGMPKYGGEWWRWTTPRTEGEGDERDALVVSRSVMRAVISGWLPSCENTSTVCTALGWV